MSDEKMIIEYLDGIIGITSAEELINITTEFLVQQLKLSNCTIQLNKHKKRFFANKEYDAVEEKVTKELKETKMTVRGTTGTKTMLAVPIMHDREMLGTIIIYSEKDIRMYGDIVNEIAKKLTKAVRTAQKYSDMQTIAITDRLTGLFNRAYFTDAFEREIRIAKNEKKPLSLIIIDLDDFKKYNDTNGHMAGDEVLMKIGKIMLRNSTTMDLPARYGGEEFVMLMPGAEQTKAYEKAEKIRQTFFEECKMTASAGIATTLDGGVLPSILFSEADKALYKAKANGKNKTETALFIKEGLGAINLNDAMGVGKS